MRGRWARLMGLAGMMSATVAVSLVAVARETPVQDAMPLPKPTEQHKKLRADVGTWDVTVKSWMEPGGDPVESKGTEVNRLMPGGLWLIQDFRGDFAGMPFRGHGVMGYDTFKKKYVGTWSDSMSTSLMIIEGDYEADGKTLVMEGNTTDPTDGKAIPMRLTTVVTGEDTRVFTMDMKMGEEYVKMMEMTYKKTGGPPEAAKKKVGAGKKKSERDGD